MKPADRYQIRQSPTYLSRVTWRIHDSRTGLALISDIKTRKQADEIKGCLNIAFYAGAEAVKTGEVIL